MKIKKYIIYLLVVVFVVIASYNLITIVRNRTVEKTYTSKEMLYDEVGVRAESLNPSVSFDGKYIYLSDRPLFEVHWETPDIESDIELPSNYTLVFGANCNGHVVMAVESDYVLYTINLQESPNVSVLLKSVAKMPERVLREHLMDLFFYFDEDSIDEQEFELLYGE